MSKNQHFLKKEVALEENPATNPHSNTKNKGNKSFTTQQTSTLIKPPRSIIRTVFSEILAFCETTSIRGVPRIVRARNRRLKILWTLFELILVAGCFTCMFLLTNQFLEYNVIHPPRVIRDRQSPFPSITICNLRPLSKAGLDILKSKNLRTPREYASAVNSFSAEHLFYKNRSEDYMKMTAAMNMAAFLESLESDEARQNLSNPKDSFILKCDVSYLEGSNNIASQCNEIGTWKRFLHAQYLNCHIFDLDKIVRNKTKTYEIILYLGEDLDSLMCPDCFSGHIKTQMSGAVVAIHEPDSFPNINERSINLIPGTLTELRIQTVENRQKEPPYGRCTPNTPSSLHIYDTNYAYTEDSCRSKTIQNAIIEKCKCRAVEYPHDTSVSGRQLPFCSSLPSFVSKKGCQDDPEVCHEELNQFLINYKCKTSVVKLYEKDLIPHCSLPCSFHSYESDRSTSQWPTKSWQLSYLVSRESKESNLTNREELKPYHEVMRLQKSGNHSEALQMMDNLRVLERNLLALLVNRPNFNLHIVEEKEVLSLTSFLSQVGGLFSIWIGLTMIFIGEVMELLSHIYDAVTERRDPSRGSLRTTASPSSPQITNEKREPYLAEPEHYEMIYQPDKDRETLPNIPQESLDGHSIRERNHYNSNDLFRSPEEKEPLKHSNMC